MREIFVKIPDENIELASQILEKLGAEITEKKTILRKPNAKKDTKQITIKKKKLPEKISPTYLFGKWKNLEIDAKKLRNEAWDRSHKLL